MTAALGREQGRPDVSYTASISRGSPPLPPRLTGTLPFDSSRTFRNTCTYELTLGGSRFKPLEMYVDADWPGREKTPRRTTGYIKMLFESPSPYQLVLKASTDYG